ncbi:MAG: uracil-DNA glycosylase [Bradymonadia bacterium]
MSTLKDLLPEDWSALVGDELDKPYFAQLEEFIANERANEQVFPPEEETFTAFQKASVDNLKVVLLGQDPYHDVGQAHGLCFSVKPGIRVPPSLVNMYKEMESDLGIPRAKHGFLLNWAEQGVLMLNTVLTVRAHQPNSHRKQGWEKFTDAVIKSINANTEKVVFILWGGPAKKKAKWIDTDRHAIVQSAHPSPLSARNGFFNSKPFSQVNAQLEAWGKDPIDWAVPEL